MQIDKYELKDELLYDTHNNWVKIEGDTATFGYTDVGMKRARDIAFVELPKKGAAVVKDQGCGAIESAKWAGEIIAPVSGSIIEVNGSLIDDPTIMNKDPYGSGWVAKIKMINRAEAASLMNAAAAAEWVKKEVLK